MNVIFSIVSRFGVVIAVTLLAGIPLGAAVTYRLSQHRARNGWPVPWAWRSAVAEVGIVLGTAPWLWMIMTPTDGAGGVRLIPFQDLTGVLGGGDAIVQLVGNLLVFAALGAFLPVRFRLGRPWSVVLIVFLLAATMSAVLEALQLVLSLGRVSSVDDVLVNALGAALASLVSIRWWRSREDQCRTMERTDHPGSWDERATLMTMLQYTRDTGIEKASGLTDAQAAAAPIGTSPLMSVGGVLNHMRWVEHSWIENRFAGGPDLGPWTDESPDQEFIDGATQPLQTVVDGYRQQAAATDAIIARLQLDDRSLTPFRSGDHPTLRWVILHLIEENARHNGHIDLLRELADGSTGD